MSLEVSSQEPLYQVLGNCRVEYLRRVGEIRQLDLTSEARAVQLSDEDYRKLCRGTYVCSDFVPCRVERGCISEVALAVRGDEKSVIPYTAWFFGGRNKQLSEPFAKSGDSLASIIEQKPLEFERMISLEGVYGSGYIEVIKREAGHLCDKVDILPLGVALTTFYDPHDIGLSRHPRPAVVKTFENYGRLLLESAAASSVSLNFYRYQERLNTQECFQLTEHSIGAVRSTIQPVAALLLPAEIYDTWIENKKNNPGEGIAEVVRVSRERCEKDGSIKTANAVYRPLDFVCDVLRTVFKLQVPTN